MINFNSRPSARGDQQLVNVGFRIFYFNSRPSARGDVLTDGNRGNPNVFQFTPLREGRLPSCLQASSRPYFNSRPSARGDYIAGQEDMSDAISIHAPPRGATMLWHRWMLSHSISIHAPPRGATALWQGGHAPSPISIHAPPRGATQMLSRTIFSSNFNSRPSARGDAVWVDKALFNDISIHAPPRGATGDHL